MNAPGCRWTGALALASVIFAANPAASADLGAGETGRRLFATNCAICHGEHGDGKGAAAVRLETPPRDLTLGVYKFRSTGSSQVPTDEDLIRTISGGIPGTAMVPRSDLTPAQIRLLVDFVKSLSGKFAKNTNPRALAIPPPPVKNKSAVAAGRKIYQESGCIECHGQRARGDGPSARKLSVKPADLTRRPLKSGASTIDVVRTILTGLDGTSMPSYHQVLTEEKIWLLAYYLESLGNAPIITQDERIGREILRQLRPAVEPRP